MSESVLSEAPHTHFVGGFPPGFEFLKGAFVDLGFENLGRELYVALSKAILGHGVKVPNTTYRIRTAQGGQTLVEPADGTETASLPLDWKQAVYVVGNDDQYTFIGNKVRPDQVGTIDKADYSQTPDGLMRQNA